MNTTTETILTEKTIIINALSMAHRKHVNTSWKRIDFEAYMLVNIYTTQLHSTCQIYVVLCQLSQVAYIIAQQRMEIFVFQFHQRLRLAHAVSP